MHISQRLRAVTTALAGAAVALSALVAVAPAASADETLRTLTVQDLEGFPGLMTPPSVIDAGRAGSTVTAWSRQWNTSAQLGFQASRPGGVQLSARLMVGADLLAPGTFEVVGYADAPELASGQARFDVGSDCSTRTGSVTIHELASTGAPGADQAVTKLALSWDVTCVNSSRYNSTGEVRIASSYPVAAAVVTSTAASPASVVLDEPATSTLTYRNLGSETAHLGQVRIEDGTYATDYLIATDGCSFATVLAGASCTVGVRVVPTQLRSTAFPAGPDYSVVDVFFPHDLDDEPVWSGAGVTVLRVLRPHPLTVTPMIERTVLDFYAVNDAGTRVEHRDAGGPWQLLTTVGRGHLRVVDPNPTTSGRTYRLVSVAPAGRPGVAGDPVVSPGAVSEELVLTEREGVDDGITSLVSVDPVSGRTVRTDVGYYPVSPVSLSVDQGTLVWGRHTGADARIAVRGVTETSPVACQLLCAAESAIDPAVGPKARYAWTTQTSTVRVSGFGRSTYVDVDGLTGARHATWARDGWTLVVASTTGSALRTVRLDATGTAVAGTLATVPRTDGARRPSASPQTDDVAFLSGSGATTLVRVAAFSGERARSVATVPDAQHVSWTADGAGLVVTTRSDLGGSTVERVDLATGDRTTVYATPAAVSGAVLRSVDREAPLVTLGAPVLGRGRAAGTIRVSDDTRPVGDLEMTCVLDNNEIPCTTAAGWSSAVRIGPHRLIVTVAHSGRPATTATVSWANRTAPRKNDLDGDGNADLLSRDATGRLYLYPGDGRGSFKPRRAYGTGWNAMTSIMSSPDFDGDGDVDVLATDAAGTVFLYPGNGRGGLGTRRVVATKMVGRVLAPGDVNGDGVDDLFWISTAGESYVAVGNGRSGISHLQGQGRGWNGFTAVVAPGDLTGDSVPDLLVRDRTGRLHMYPTSQYGYLLPPVSYGLGWNAMTALTGPGDFNGDGKADLLVRDTTGRLHLYPGNGAGGFKPRISYGTGWNAMTAIVG